MTEVVFSSSFKRAYKKVSKNKILEKKFWEKLEIFIHDPYDRRLRTHQLSGRLKNLWSYAIDYDSRVIFYFEDNNHAVFVDIGTHDEVY